MARLFLNLKLAFLNLNSHKLRTFLTMLGITIGTLALILVVSLGESAQKSVALQIQKLGSNLITILPGKAEEGKPPLQLLSTTEIKSLKNKDLLALKKLPKVLEVCGYVRGSGRISYLKKSKNILFSGVSPEFLKVENASLKEGRFFTSKEEKTLSQVVVLGSEIADYLFGKENPIGKKVKINGKSYKVIGVMKKRGKILFLDYDNFVFLPLKTAQKKILGIDHLHLIRIKAQNEKDLPFLIELVKKTLRKNHHLSDPKKDDFTVRSIKQALEIFYLITNTLKLFIALIASVALIVGGIGVSNVMYVVVDERIREIGLKKAVGAKNRDILFEFLEESILLTFLGAILGILLSFIFLFILKLVLTNYFNLEWSYHFSFLSLLIALLTAFLIGLFFGFFPAKKASKIFPAQALRYE